MEPHACYSWRAGSANGAWFDARNITRHDLSLGSQQQYDALAQERCSLWGGGRYKGEAHPAIVFIEIYSQQSFGTGSEGSRNVARLVVRTIR